MWQRTAAEDLIAGHGRVVVEYFDVGCSRRRPWRDRPQAAALLATVADPDRGFDAIVVGGVRAGFYGDQLANLAPVLAARGVPGGQRQPGAGRRTDGRTRTYLLVGLVRCGGCGRRMHSHWLRGRPAYRCRHGHTSAHPASHGRPRYLYLREDRILARVAVDLRGEVGHEAPGDPAGLAEYLRQRGITIICRQDSCTLVTNTEIDQPLLIA